MKKFNLLALAIGLSATLMAQNTAVFDNYQYKAVNRFAAEKTKNQYQNPHLGWFHARSQHLPQRRRLLFGELHLQLFPRGAHLAQQGFGELATNRPCAEPRITTSASQFFHVPGGLCAGHQIQSVRQQVLHDYDRNRLRQHVYRDHGRPQETKLERPHRFERRSRYRPVPVF